MSTIRLTKTILILLIIIVSVGCDQVSKRIVRQNIPPNEVIHLLSDRLTVTNVENTGAFLSVGSSFSKTMKNIFLSLLPCVAVCLGLFYVLTKQNLGAPLLLGLCLVIGGGIGNVADRIIYGSVTDFVHVDFGIFQTGIFNMADLSIMAGVAIILFQSIFRKEFP